MEPLSPFSLIWLFTAICCANLAKRRNRSVVGWFLAGAVFNFLALILLACLPNYRKTGITAGDIGRGLWRLIAGRRELYKITPNPYRPADMPPPGSEPLALPAPERREPRL